MFERFKTLFTSTATPVAFIDDMPAHKGFTATMQLGSIKLSRTFKTLKEAQVWIAESKVTRRKMQSILSWKIITATYRIRNLETGKFAPYNWTLTRGDLV